MLKVKIVLIAMLSFFFALSIIIGFGFFELEYKKYFAPKHEDVNRQIFENTKSYSHGKTQQLAKYYDEYKKSDEPEAITELIKINFADFDETKIRNYKLKQFLINQRGY